MSNNGLDQFYTKPSIVEKVLSMIDCSKYELVLEPSAGAGDFLERLPKATRVGVDLEPAHPEVTQQDFFDYVPHLDTTNILTIGNPPFGKNSSLAVRFFNHAASFSDCIAFIVPRTFRKASIINKLDTAFHLVEEEILPRDAFYLPTGESYEVPTVFQVWQRHEHVREGETIYSSHPDFDFLGTDSYSFTDVDVNVAITGGFYGAEENHTYHMSNLDLKAIKDMRKKYPKMFSPHRVVKAKKILTWNIEPDFAWRRAGSRAGEIFLNYQEQPTEGFEFIKIRSPDAMHIFTSLWEDTWNPEKNTEKREEKWDTAGQPSISKHELIKAYIQAKENNG